MSLKVGHLPFSRITASPHHSILGPIAEAAPKTKPIRVSELAARIKRLLEDGIPYVCVEGEVSNFKRSTKGHLYFSLKDEKAVIDCVMWGSAATSLKFQVENGLAVVACGTVSFFDQWGKTQLYVRNLSPAGVGALQLAFEQMKERLQKEGLFDEARKRPLPFLPMFVGVVTSPTGAVRHDIEDTIQRRFPGMRTELYPVPVQGDGAAEEIAEALKKINRLKDAPDVLIVGRGGGSMEDLWAFNEEVLARAIAASAIPVISAVGHETDFTIADFVADRRAKTPTEAAVIAVPEKAELLRQLEGASTALDGHADDALALLAERLAGLAGRHGLLRIPADVSERRRRVADLARRIVDSLKAPIERMRSDLRARRPVLLDRASRLLPERRERVDALGGRLEALSPLKVLERGYTMTRDEAGRVVTDASALQPGDRIRTRFRRGEAASTVEGVSPG